MWKYLNICFSYHTTLGLTDVKSIVSLNNCLNVFAVNNMTDTFHYTPVCLHILYML